MLIDVAFLPLEAEHWENVTCIVVDVLRATSSIVTMFDRGCQAVVPFPSVAAARRSAREYGYVLAGERLALAPPGFDFGNSPVEIGRADLLGKTVAFTTTNGTAALRWLVHAPAVLAGSLLNAEACCRQALALAGRFGGGIGVVCAGRHGRFVLDDSVCAGYLVCTLLSLLGARDAESLWPGEEPAGLTDSARAAVRLLRGGDIPSSFRASGSGRRLAEINLLGDVDFCTRPDVSESVPVLVRGAPDRFVLARENADGMAA